MEQLLHWVRFVDSRLAIVVAACLQPLAVYILLSGFDDVILDCVWLSRLWRRRQPPPPTGAGRRIALMIPCWHEQDVIANMVEHNRAAIRYSNYEIFIGAYRKDAATQAVVRSLAARDAKVHLAVVPHDGPTVKADCLNWV